ncbi:DNA polymerase delta, subunit 4-domain-containing protein [Butyriboletus roseoflavus]|nr:DNA polymerase delta, subunit 4-domain-containing protein [Butyriboletus roseoflavus]
MQDLKQGTLSFTSAKRTTGNSTPNAKPQQKIPVTEKGRKKQTETPLETLNEAKTIEVPEVSDEEGTTAVEVTVPANLRMRASTGTKVRPSSRITPQEPLQPLQSEKQKPSPEEIGREHLDIQDKAGRYRKYYHEVRSKMGHIEPIHSEGQNRIHQMLRLFDMSYEFGPCIGMTRLERWERAETFGLNPPVEVRDILLTKEGIESAEYARCVLHGEV